MSLSYPSSHRSSWSSGYTSSTVSSTLRSRPVSSYSSSAAGTSDLSSGASTLRSSSSRTGSSLMDKSSSLYSTSGLTSRLGESTPRRSSYAASSVGSRRDSGLAYPRTQVRTVESSTRTRIGSSSLSGYRSTASEKNEGSSSAVCRRASRVSSGASPNGSQSSSVDPDSVSGRRRRDQPGTAASPESSSHEGDSKGTKLQELKPAADVKQNEDNSCDADADCQRQPRVSRVGHHDSAADCEVADGGAIDDDVFTDRSLHRTSIELGKSISCGTSASLSNHTADVEDRRLRTSLVETEAGPRACASFSPAEHADKFSTKRLGDNTCLVSHSSASCLSGSRISRVEEIATNKHQKQSQIATSSDFEGNSRKPKVGVTSKGTLNTGQDVAPPPGISAAAQEEIVRLESLCESRTKELTHTRIQLRASSQAFDAMAVLFKYCCADLKAFECPALAKKLETVQRQLADCISQIGDLSFQKEALEESLSRTRQEKEEVTRQMEETQAAVERQQQEHAQITQEMDSTHNAALTAQRDELTSKHDENVHKLNQVYERQLETLRLVHDRQMLDLKNEFKLESNALKISHLEEIQALRNKHDDQMEELHKQHRGKLEDITHRFESIKLSLSEKVESLRCECDDLARRARNSEEALQRDAETKVQIALAPYLNLPNEIDSLKIVLEMRNEEIQKLRTKNMDVEKQLEEVPIGREKIISLQQKVENLEAIINIKTDHEKQLHEKCQKLMRKYDHESRTNKRLSRDYEQVLWRMSQSSEFGGSCESLMRQLSRSPPRSKESSPDSRQSANSQKLDNDVDGVVMRVKKRSSQSVSEGDRKLRSRSATFVVEKIDSSDSHSPSCSPQLKQKRWRHKSQNQDVTPVNETADWTCESTTENESSSDFCQINSESTKDMTESCRMSSSDMSNSYTRSLSVVSDSGMCDSMTKSDDVFNSLVVSSDSEWGTSVNLSVNCEFVLSDSQCAQDVGDIHSFSETTLVLTNPSESSFTAINKSQHL